MLKFLWFVSIILQYDALRIYMTSSSSKSITKPQLSGKVLIVQNKGGGHGTVGYQLCKELLTQSPNLKVTMLQDKCNYSKSPFNAYKELEELGVEIVETKLAGESVSLPDTFKNIQADYVIDNWSKNQMNASFVLDIAKSGNAKQLLFISSAGMYKPINTSPHVETDPVKTNDPREVELAITESGLPYTFMRPQYIYGPKISKRYLDYFIARAYRNLHIPLPMSGDQLVCLTHIEDTASLIAAAVGHPSAMNQVFNCGTDRYVSYKGICQLIHKELGTSEDNIKYMYYDPKAFTHWEGGFPFRRETFITTPSKAKLLLGWKPKHIFSNDVKDEVADYMSTSDASKKWGFEELKNDLEVK